MTTAELIRRVVEHRTARERSALLGQIRTRREALAAQQAEIQQQDSELDRALALLGDLPYARAILGQVQAQLSRNLDVMHGGLVVLDDLLEELDPCADSPSS